VTDDIVQWFPRGYFHASKANPFCREAEMIDLKKKCWREKVTAEITVAHMLQFARELGTSIDAAEAATFLNEHGRAQAVWTHMMQAGEEFLKSSLAERTRFHKNATAVTRSVMPHSPLPHKNTRPSETTSVLYQ
jgi:hypothetical protein